MNTAFASSLKPFSNYHTHTVFCDGSDTPRLVAQTAVLKGFKQLGFSAHAMYPYASLWHMNLNEYQAYCTEIRLLAEEYKDSLEIFHGFEADYFPLLSKPQKSIYSTFLPDYLIGSVHFLIGDKPENGCFTADGSAAEVAGGIRDVFGGSAKKAVQTYFATQRDMARNCDFDIVGHPDVIRKRNGELCFFDEGDIWYKHELEETARVFASAGKIVEINTGGIARGMMKDVYPSADFLLFLRRFDVPIVINSDAHAAENLDYAFDFAIEAAKKAGYCETAVLKKNGGSPVWESSLL